MKNNDSKLQIFIKSGTIQVILAITSLLSAIVALYITSRIQPLLQNDALMAQQVHAIEADYARGTLVQTGFNHIDSKFTEQDKRLERMENKIDVLLGNR